jgi:hypothetical protein
MEGEGQRTNKEVSLRLAVLYCAGFVLFRLLRSSSILVALAGASRYLPGYSTQAAAA